MLTCPSLMSLWPLHQWFQFHVYLQWVNTCLAGAFKQEKAKVGACSMIVNLQFVESCELYYPAWPPHRWRMQTAKHWSLATRWPPSPCCPAAATHARVAVSRPLIARQLRTGSSRHGGMGDFVHAAVTCYILINSPAGKKYKSNHVCYNFSFFIHRETPNFVLIDVKQVRLHGRWRGGQEGRS